MYPADVILRLFSEFTTGGVGFSQERYLYPITRQTDDLYDLYDLYDLFPTQFMIEICQAGLIYSRTCFDLQLTSPGG